MGFFDLPEREPDEDHVDEDEDGPDELRPAPWTAGVVPVELVAARSDEAAVVVSGVRAYPEGFELTVDAFLHRSVPRRRRSGLYGPTMWHHSGRNDDALPGELLRFGLAWPDGGRATNIDQWGRRAWPDATEPTHGLEERGGGGSDLQYRHEFWAWPLPAGGALRCVVEWPEYGIPETSAEIDGALIVGAAERARPVWPEDGGRASHIPRWSMMRTMQARAEAAGAERRTP
jgi:hypothetical protein